MVPVDTHDAILALSADEPGLLPGPGRGTFFSIFPILVEFAP
jgi:hypothetical protein